MHEHALLDKPVVIHADNTGAIALAKNPEYHARKKHGLLNRNGLVKRRIGWIECEELLNYSCMISKQQ